MIAGLAFAVSFGLYLLFAGQASGTEIAAGLPAAVLVAIFAGLQHRGQHRRVRLLRAPWHRLLLRPMAALVTDSAAVGRQLLRAIVSPAGTVSGSSDRQPFRPGEQERPADAGRRALVTLASSLAPNGFVLDAAPSTALGDAPVLLMHRLAPAAPNPDREWPV